MAAFDLPLDELERYRPPREEPGDFDRFWQATLEEARSFPLNPVFTPVQTPLVTLEVRDVTFAGFGGQPIKGWLVLPARRLGPLPCVVEFVGYGGGRGYPWDWLLYACAGYAHLVMDTRGQGGTWRHGDTPDPGGRGDPHHPGFLTQGVLDPAHAYYRRLITDAVRAVEAARAHPAVEPGRVAVAGISQGGGLALAVAALVPDVRALLADVPFLCHHRRAVQITDAVPYVEVARYCRAHRERVEQVFQTLSYFDGVNFAPRATAPALFSVGLHDQTCPPSTVYAAYNHYGGEARMQVWPFAGHEGGESAQAGARLAFLSGILGPPPA
ncbi:acetylxylan esterase [Deinococcus planocerae]|uniref:acetylxylan esterase n=1 Tax=Deinococcus planocerae TaxID=1737569 RepID=UPI000C7EEEF6|nr:acetylxylan esterase [Deinococcus planocerae]